MIIIINLTTVCVYLLHVFTNKGFVFLMQVDVDPEILKELRAVMSSLKKCRYNCTVLLN